MKIDISAMRKNHTDWKEGLKALAMDGFCIVDTLPVVVWGGREYAVIRGPKLQEGAQQVEAIDLTEFDGDRSEPYLTAARFGTSWPGPDAVWQMYAEEGESEEACLKRLRRRVVYIQPDEGHCALLCEDGDTRWCDGWTVGFMVRVIPGTQQEFEKMREQIMDDLEEAVDSGGRLNF